MKKIWILIACLIAILTTTSLSAKSSDDRIAELEKRLANLQKTYMTNNQDVASSVARAQGIHDEFSSLKGQVDANAHQLKAQNEELMKLISDLQNRMQSMEDRIDLFSSQVTSALGKVAPGAAAEAENYQKALDLANSSKYLEAASAFEAFTRKFPKSSYLSSAREWIAECFYSSRDYKRAIKEFQTFIEQFPKDSKVPSAVLKQGNSFYELGMLEEAKAFYEKILSSYPNSTAASQAKAKLARIENKKSATGSGSYPEETIEQQRKRLSEIPSTGTKQEPTTARESTPRDF